MARMAWTLVHEGMARLAPGTVMVVDDDQDLLLLMQHLLERAGYRVLASTAPPDEDDVRRHDPQLLILDVDLGRWNGIRYCRGIKEQDRYAGLPVVVISGGDVERTEREASMAGANAHLAKPFAGRDLLEVVRRFASPR